MDEERIEVLERIGAYAAGELSEVEARETERLLRADPDQRRTAEAYNRMFVLLSVMQQEAPEAPRGVVSHAIRRAYVSAFFRQAEELFAGLGRAYAGAFVYYLGLRGEAAGGGT